MLICDNQSCFNTVSGHGMIVEGHPDHEIWGRRLMASVPENETEEKNCSAPGTQSWNQCFSLTIHCNFFPFNILTAMFS